MLGYLPTLVTLLFLSLIIAPFSLVYLGLIHYTLSFIWLIAVLACFYIRSVKEEAREERLRKSPELIDEGRRAKALDYWVNLHKKVESKD